MAVVRRAWTEGLWHSVCVPSTPDVCADDAPEQNVVRVDVTTFTYLLVQCARVTLVVDIDDKWN